MSPRPAAWLLALAVGGCASTGDAEALPARLLDPDAAVRAELQQVVAAAVGQRQVTLADDALTRDGVLLLERVVRTDPAGHRLPGRDLGQPVRFQLFQVDGDCILEHSASGERWMLRHARCGPLTGD